MGDIATGLCCLCVGRCTTPPVASIGLLFLPDSSSLELPPISHFRSSVDAAETDRSCPLDHVCGETGEMGDFKDAAVWPSTDD